MADQEIYMLPALSNITDETLFPVYEPSAAAGLKAQKATGAQLEAFAREAGREGGNDLAKGATYTPAVTELGVLSWTNDQGLENPAPVDLREVLVDNKPSGSYTGNGAPRTIDTKGDGNTVLIYSDSEAMFGIVGYSGIVHVANGAVTRNNAINFRNGIITIAGSVAATMNVNGITYNYQVL